MMIQADSGGPYCKNCKHFVEDSGEGVFIQIPLCGKYTDPVQGSPVYAVNARHDEKYGCGATALSFEWADKK